MRTTALLTLTLAIPPSLSWDPLGHQTVGFLASKYFKATTTSHLTTLLSLSPTFDIGDAAAWADTVRDGATGGLPWSKNWHFINAVNGYNPSTNTCTIAYPSDCPRGDCIVDAILNQTRIVTNPAAGVDARRNATMWVLHFFGDLHQPLHASGYKAGGNLVRPVVFGAPAEGGRMRNLHAVWDSSIPRKLRGLGEREGGEVDKRAAREWAEEIYERQVAGDEGVLGVDVDVEGGCGKMGCVVDWAVESNKVNCEHVFAKGEDWVLSHDLSGDYFLENAKVVESQIGKAGVRLGAWMNALADILDQFPPETFETTKDREDHIGGDL